MDCNENTAAATSHARGLVRSPLLVVVLAAMALSGAARAESEGVALALNLADATPVLRDMAAGVAREALARWQMLTPQLGPENVERCQAEESCLLALSRERRASHLLLVGVAALNSEEYVLSYKLLDVSTGEELVTYADVARSRGVPREASARMAAKHFADVPALRQPAATRTMGHARGDAAVAKPGSESLSPLGSLGWGFTGAGVALCAGALGLGAAATANPSLLGDDTEGWLTLSSGVSVAVLAAGLSLVGADGLGTALGAPQGSAE